MKILTAVPRSYAWPARGLGGNPFEGTHQWTREETSIQRYGQSMVAIRRFADLKTTKETNDSRKRTFEEYLRFLAQNPFAKHHGWNGQSKRRGGIYPVGVDSQP